MVPSVEHAGGVPGTIDAFNFIRRVGFPPTPEVVSVFITIAGLAIIVTLPLSGVSLSSSLVIAIVAVILPTLVGEFLNSGVFLRGDPILDFRRLMGMELVSWSTLLVFLPASSLLGVFLGDRTLWIDGFLIALTASLPVRFLTLFAMSRLSFWRKLVAAVLVPFASFRLFAGVSIYLSIQSIQQILPGLLTLISSMFLSGLGVWWIIRSVDKAGSSEIGDSPMGLFRDFLQHWLKSDSGPLEERLAAIGRIGNIEVSTLAFEAPGNSRSCVIASNFHPGPYRDLGSGGLPSRLKAAIESYLGSIALVPHGISNHEYNIISGRDIEKLLQETRERYPSTQAPSGASRFIRETVEEAKASAQVFGNTVLLTLTLAPIDMEDIPSHVREEVEAEAQKRGFNAIIIDAHNSLKHQTSISPEQAHKLKDAAIKALDTAGRLLKSPFKVGVATDPLPGFNLENGIGPGGLSMITVESQGQLVAYLTIDGNNMKTGFRETVLSSMKGEGVDDGEVMTTDTHLVAGVVRSKLGYHPVGENMDNELFLAKVREILKKAKTGMGEAAVGFATFDLRLRVLGSSSFQTITSFVGRIARWIGRSFFRLELAVFALSVVLLALV